MHYIAGAVLMCYKQHYLMVPRVYLNLTWMLKMQHSLWCIFQTSPNSSKWEEAAQRTLKKQLSGMYIQAAHSLQWFWPSTLCSGVLLAIKPLVHPWPAVFHQKPFFSRSLGNSAEKPADISGVLSTTSTSPLREILNYFWLPALLRDSLFHCSAYVLP